ncbi:MAG: DegV family protein [Eubacteriales bacterium]|nr:DegV family protein [Eubacteriales bacterium]
MQNYILSCCSTADLTAEHFEARDIHYVCFHFIIDGISYPDDLGKTMSSADFYAKIKTGAQPTTAQVNVGQYIEFFKPFLEAGQDILHVSLSTGLSGSYNAATTARAQLLEQYPDRRIELVDSLGASSGYGLLMDMLADRRDAGASLDELRDWAEANKLTIHHWFFSSDLTSYIRGGRISKTAGFFGSLLGVCPLLNMDVAGHLTPREKIRTKKKVIQRIVDMMKAHAANGDAYDGKCYISQSACLEDAQAVAAMVEAAFPKLNGPVEINNVGTVIGSHTGCGTVALFFVGDKRED